MSRTPRAFTVISWNILYDHHKATKVRPQVERYTDSSNTLRTLDKPLDVVALYEVEDDLNAGNLGLKIAELLGHNASFWVHHSRQREQLGMFGKLVREVNFVELGSGKTAALTKVGDIPVVGVHLTYRLTALATRTREVRVVLDLLANEPQAVIMGDFNSLAWQRPRQLLEENGFQSVFTLLGLKRPPTCPTPDHRHLLRRWQRLAIGKGLSVDDLYIKGLEVVDAGTFQGKSDHLGLWATLRR